jgi:hypothetical protein
LEESYYLQASLDTSDSLSEQRNFGEATMNPYYMKSMTPNAFESALRQKEGELASYMSRLVCIAFFLNFMLKVLLVITYLHAVCCIVHSGAEFSQCVSCVDMLHLDNHLGLCLKFILFHPCAALINYLHFLCCPGIHGICP